MVESPRVHYAPRGDGAHIGFDVLGDGPPMVSWPGGMINAASVFNEPRLARMQRRIASFATRVMLDRRGMGYSDPLTPGEPPTLERQMGDLLCVLDYLRIERATLWGNAWDAQAVMLFAATHPDRVDKLILTSTSPCPGAREGWPYGVPPHVLTALFAEFEHPGEGWGPKDLPELLTPSNPTDEVLWNWMAEGGRQGPAVARAYVEIAAAADVRDIISAIQAPTLLVQNTHDRFTRIEGARYMAERIPGARLVEFDSADHIMTTTHLEEKLDVFESFVTDAPRPGIHRRLLTVLFTDIVGSTELLAGVPDARWTSVLDHVDATVEREVRRRDGRVCKSMGDGHLALFERPSDAVASALSIAAELRMVGVDIRAGAHIGEVELRGDDVAGVAVHVGARVAGKAGAGELLVTRTLADLIAGSPYRAETFGEVELKGLPGCWPLMRITPA